MHRYHVLYRVYESVLKLNPVLERYGYVFESYGYKEFVKLFDKIISFGVELKNVMDIHTLYFHNPIRDLFVNETCPMILLKELDEYSDTLHPIEPGYEKKRDNDFVKHLIAVLRLYKHGMIEEIMSFDYNVNTKEWGKIGINRKKSLLHDEYLIEDLDVEKISAMLKRKVEPNQLSSLAYNSFQECYILENKSLKFILLMTALESLFNRGKDQISHTCSRHLSVLISQNIDEFKFHYKEMKKLYDFRSSIVHGSLKEKSDLNKKIMTLESYVRTTLNIVLELNMSKDDFFDYLNAKGYNEP